MTRNRVNVLLRSRTKNVARCAVSQQLIANKDERGLRMTERSEKRRTGDALASRADEGRGTLRKASGSRVQATSR
jgi:hypothetical protein